MSSKEMYAVTGFEEALIGTGMRSPFVEVLMYDGYKAQALLEALGYEDMDLPEYLYSIGLDELGEEAPIFVYLDSGILDECREANAGGRVVH